MKIHHGVIVRTVGLWWFIATQVPVAVVVGEEPSLDVYIDYDECFRAVVRADRNGDGLIRRNEYAGFIREYGNSICYDDTNNNGDDDLTPEQGAAFLSLACLCANAANEFGDCCLGDNAAINTAGASNASTRTAEQDDYLRAVCQLTHRTMMDESTLCTTEATTSPISPASCPDTESDPCMNKWNSALCQRLILDGCTDIGMSDNCPRTFHCREGLTEEVNDQDEEDAGEQTFITTCPPLSSDCMNMWNFLQCQYLIISGCRYDMLADTTTCPMQFHCQQPTCPRLTDSCMNVRNYIQCNRLIRSGCRSILTLESCPLQFQCGDDDKSGGNDDEEGGENGDQDDDESFSRCQRYMLYGDVDRDGRLNQEEYVRFLYWMTADSSIPALGMFSDLDPVFQAAFFRAGFGADSIDITGSRPGSTPSQEELEALRLVCTVVNNAIRIYEEGQVEDEEDTNEEFECPPLSAECMDDETFRVCENLREEGCETIRTIKDSCPLQFECIDEIDGGQDGTITEEDFRACLIAMAISDLDRNSRLDEQEFARFLNRMADNAFSGMQFYELDGIFQETFYTWTDSRNSEGEGVIGIEGSMPGVNDDQAEHLRPICVSMQNAVRVYNRLNPSEPEEEVPGKDFICPKATDTCMNEVNLRSCVRLVSSGCQSIYVAESCPFQFFCDQAGSERNCFLPMTEEDLNNDGYLDQEEFVQFLNRLGDLSIAESSFDELDSVLQEAFTELEDPPGFLDVKGSDPGALVTADQREYLLGVCNTMYLAVEQFINGEPFTCPSLSDSCMDNDNLRSCEKLVKSGCVSVVTAKSCPLQFFCNDTGSERRCFLSMAEEDVNGDNTLDQEEYIRFLNRLADLSLDEFPFDELDVGFQEAFLQFADPPEFLDIEGAQPGALVSPDQREYLLAVCDAVYIAIETYTAGTNIQVGATLNACPPLSACLDTDGQAQCTDAIESGCEELLVLGSCPLLLVCTNGDNSMFDPFFGRCVRSLLVADLNGDGLLDSFEYTRFVSRFMEGTEGDLAFDDLDPEFQSDFLGLAGENGVFELTTVGSVLGVDESMYLRSICWLINHFVMDREPGPHEEEQLQQNGPY